MCFEKIISGNQNPRKIPLVDEECKYKKYKTGKKKIIGCKSNTLPRGMVYSA